MIVIDAVATGQRMREIRKEKKIKSIQVADAMGFQSCQSVYNWESGRKLPDIENLFTIADMLGVTVDELVVRRKV